MSNNLNEISTFIESQLKGFKPEIGIILGSGLGTITDQMTLHARIHYSDIPHFPVSTVTGHSGELLFGHIASRPVVCMKGRFHYYEGFSMQQVALPVYVMKALGIHTLLVSNASGGVNPTFKVGDIMLIRDHINLFATNPLIGPNDERMGPRFPSMHEAYDHQLLNKALELAQELHIDVKQGIYAGLSGPCYETPAEYRYIRAIGGDAVGMSTVPEVIAAKHAGLKVFGISVISDLGGGDHAETVSHEAVLEAVNLSTPKVALLVEHLIAIA